MKTVNDNLQVISQDVEDEPEETVEDEEEDEELIDPMDTLKDDCREKPNCVSFNEKLQQCADRVNSRSKTEETCEEELMDYFHCVDHCVSKTLFSKLK
ncbi:Uncharacterised protein g551 [Pycnogonum litorale]